MRLSYRGKLVAGLAVDLHVLEGDYKGKYKTHVDEVGEKRVSIFAPSHMGEIVPLREGTRVEIVFWDEIASYAMETVIEQRIAVPVQIFVLEFPDDIRRVQRRNFVRVAAYYPVSFQVVERTGLSNMLKGNMLDLSGGGMRFQTSEKIEKDALIYTFFQLPTGEIKTPARVCRVEPIEDTRKSSVSVEFYQISDRERNRITRCVFDIQREMRKKGLV
jgi:c-di-GMP-binding flagellar brake protein YcgR